MNAFEWKGGREGGRAGGKEGTYLALALGAKGGLVDGHQHFLVIASQDQTVQPAIDRTHVRGCELGEFVEALPGRERGRE